MPTTTILGPQRHRPIVGRVVRRIEGPIAAITAGWQERENDPLPRGLARRATNLGIYRRSEQAFDEDRELANAHRDRQLHLKQLQRLYRLRLDHAVAAFKELDSLVEETEPGGDPTVSRETGAALEAIRELDQHHLDRVREVHDAFEDRWRPHERDAVARRRRELAEELDAVEAVVIAGGHVAVLLNRLRLFDLGPLLAAKTLVAWSAGAMVAARRIVLFHDSPPWGAGNSEVLDRGLGLVDDVLPLPDCRRRLRVEDPRRVELLARRFAPLACVGLDPASQLSNDGEGWRGRDTLVFQAAGKSRHLGGSRWEPLEP